jgi:hypothetical protein
LLDQRAQRQRLKIREVDHDLLPRGNCSLDFFDRAGFCDCRGSADSGPENRDENIGRAYLSGDVIRLLRALFERANGQPGSHLRLALYELGDDELTQMIVDNPGM